MAKTVKIVRLMTNQTLISEIAEIAAVVPGEPDCKLINPFVVKEDNVLEPVSYTHLTLPTIYSV